MPGDLRRRLAIGRWRCRESGIGMPAAPELLRDSNGPAFDTPVGMLRARVIVAATIVALLAPWAAPCLMAAPAEHAQMPCCGASHDGGPAVRACCAASDSQPAVPPAWTATALPALAAAVAPLVAPVPVPLSAPAAL